MSASSINRSLSTVRTELEFLRESNVINETSYRDILGMLPERYEPPRSTPTVPSSQSEFVEAIYAFQAQQDGDLNLQVGDKIEVLEKPSPEWYKGRCNGRVGMFPSNYVKPAFSGSNASLERPNVPAPPEYQSQQIVPQATNTSANSNYSQPPFPPPSTAYYQGPPQQYQPQQQYQQQYYQGQQATPQPAPAAPAAQQGTGSSHTGAAFKKFGGKLGNAAIFGAGATIGSDIVNSIF